MKLDPEDLLVETFRPPSDVFGPRSCCIRITHKPTNNAVSVEGTSEYCNLAKEKALKDLADLVTPNSLKFITGK